MEKLGSRFAKNGLGLVVAFSFLSACSTIVIPPAAPENPRPVFVLEHGQHSSLVLPGEKQGIVRYSYGDWNYYALGNKGISSGLRALQGPTLAGLGRRELKAPATEEGVYSAVRVPIAAIHTVPADSAAIENLRSKLDKIYRTNSDSLIYNAAIDLEFVHHPVPYSSEHNSNRVVADWLSALGCEVRGPTFVPNWKFVRPKSASAGLKCPVTQSFKRNAEDARSASKNRRMLSLSPKETGQWIRKKLFLVTRKP